MKKQEKKGKTPKLTVIIPTKNEEKTIGKCISSVLEAVKGIDAEIILVDSYSTDDTIKIAEKFPISIYQLRRNWFISTGAGLYSGVNLARGKYVQYIDGDSVFDTEWFKKAIAIFNRIKNPKIAGLAGYWEYWNKRSGNIAKLRKRVEKDTKKITVGGPILFKTSVLKKNNYYPFFKRATDAELVQRLASKGYKIKCIPIKMLATYDRQMDIRKFIHRHYNYGITWGMAIKKNRDKPYILTRIFSKVFIILSTLIIGLIVCFFWLPLILFIVLGVSLLLIGLAALWIKRITIPMLLIASILSFFRVVGAVKGLFKTYKNPGKYPKDIKIIK